MPDSHMPDDQEMLRYTPPKRLRLAGIVAVCIAALVVVVGVITRVTADRSVAAWTDTNALPVVSVINLGQAEKAGDLTLPGNVQAFNSAPIYARVSGYLKKWYVDIGAKVKSGQLLAEIDIPDQDQQLAQARADLGTAVANQKLSGQTAKRWNALAKDNAAAPQDVDEKNADLAAKTAAVASAQANVSRLHDLTNFERLTAPFDGTVTSRSVDIGSLVTVGAPGTTPLFTVSETGKLRIYVNVPQNYSAMVRPGMTAKFTVPEYPGETFTATVNATAQAVDPTTGTVLVQLLVDNSQNRLKPGDYAQVRFDLPANANSIRLPASALIFTDDGTAVAVVGSDNHVSVKPVTILRDYGTSVEIAAGVSRTDRVIDNPPDALKPGDAVRVAKGS
jgi:RND family efflux transporter MFP subunit